MNSKREFRYIPAKALRVAKTDDGKRTLSGYAAVFNSLSEDLGGWREQILPGAFSKCLASNPDIVCLRDHNQSMILGRTTSGTVKVTQDEIGLRFDCDLPNTSVANDLVTLLERGDVRGCSFGMFCLDENWHTDNGLEVRDVIEAEVFDVSVVSSPAYPATSVQLRSLFPDGNIEVPKPVEAEPKAEDTTDAEETRNLQLRIEIAKRL